MNPVDVLKLPFRALDDLHTLAQEARRATDGREDLTDRLDEALSMVRQVSARIERLDATATELTAVGREIHEGGEELTATARDLTGVSREIRDGGQELDATGRRLLGATRDVHEGGKELEREIERTQEQLEPVANLAERIPGSGRRRR